MRILYHLPNLASGSGGLCLLHMGGGIATHSCILLVSRFPFSISKKVGRRDDNLVRKLVYSWIPYLNGLDITRCNRRIGRVRIQFLIPEPSMGRIRVLVYLTLVANLTLPNYIYIYIWILVYSILIPNPTLPNYIYIYIRYSKIHFI